jgi:hypothetical protein
VILPALLSLLPAQDMVQTGIPGQLEHFVAYAGSASIGVAGYGARVAVRIISSFWVYAAFLSISSSFRRADIRRSRIFRHRRSERLSEGSLQPCSRVVDGTVHIRTSSDFRTSSDLMI